MKPIRLTVQAFGPYADRETFDFEDLQGRSLFLISGPTGSGKTTVLDAICCALYGSTSGGDRTPDEMRSQHAAAGIAPEVVFDFRLGDKAYRASRCLEHERPRKRGGGTMTEPHTATLSDITGVADPDDEGIPLATQWDKVTKKVEELLGFRDDEFRQVVLIPQGRFRDLLVAESKAREDILVTLFRTRHYNVIERALKDAFLGVDRRLRELQQNRQGVLNVEGVPTLEALAAMSDGLEVERVAAEAQAATARAVRGAADVALAEGQRAKGLLDERARARTACGELESRKDEMAAVRAEATRGRAARSLRDAEEEAVRRKAEWQDRQAEAAKAADDLRVAGEVLDAAGRDLEAQRAREPEQVELQRRSAALEGLVAQVAGVAQARAEVAGAEQAEAAARARLEAAQRLGAALEQEVAGGRTSLEQADRLAGTLEAAGLALQKAEEVRGQRLDLQAARGELGQAEAAGGKARADVEESRRLHDEARQALERSERALREGAAGLLAGTLRGGEPCPVCGSTTHPAPARAAEDLPDPAAVEAERAGFRTLVDRLQVATDADRVVQARVAAVQARVDVLALALGPRAGAETGDLERECVEARQRVAEASAAVRDREEIAKAQADREARLARTVAEVEAGQQAVHAAGAALEAARARRIEREAAVPEALRDPAALERERNGTAGRLRDLKQALEGAVARHLQATNLRASCDARARAASAAADGAKTLADQRQAAFLARVAEAGFEGEGRYVEARRTDEELAALDARFEDWGRALAAARDRLERAEAAAEGAIAPDLDALQGASSQAGQALDLAVDRASRLAQQVDQKRATLDSLRRDAEAMAVLERDYAVLGSLSEAANGRNALNITFQRYVLGALLDDVLVAATARLKQMSAGRYHLQRVGTVGDRRRLAGLDLEVMDTYTGLARPVGTLSGGESFMAALSLALGMADVVQSYAGGIRLETVFIDEGFGSLDPEALDQALRELVKLKEGGRLVGIISHVPELRQRIDARLEVTAGRTGSRARFVVG